MRIVGLETEYALGFEPAAPGRDHPSQRELFKAVLAALKTQQRSLEAVYYKGGDFLQDGSLIHFEVARIDDASVGLLEWATPECLGALEAATYAKAQEASLKEAVAVAERELSDQGYAGRILLLKNNEDRYGNAYGCHESYDVVERPRSWPGVVDTAFLHPLMLALNLVLALLLALPVLLVLCLLGTATLAAQVVEALPGLGWLGRRLQRSLRGGLDFLVEASPTPGSGLVAHASLAFLRLGGALFSLTARRVLFHGHQAALMPFLATRPILGGAGMLGADGRYVLTPRAHRTRSAVAAFVYGNWRPLIDVKEYFYRRPFSYLAPRKRLHILSGNSNRSEYAEVLTLATTERVLDAIEAGALDGVAARLELLGGPVGAFKRTSADPTLAAPVARDRVDGALLSALDIQRRYLEAVWAHCSAQPQVTPEAKDALVRWNFVLDRLADDPRTLDQELDWVIKLKAMQAAIVQSLPETSEPWVALSSWGPVNQLLEAIAPHVELAGSPSAAAVRSSLRGALGGRRFRKAAAAVRERGLDWAAFPAVRRAYLRLKAIDLKYHELSSEGGYYDWLAAEGAVARVLDPERIERARTQPPQRTRATIRGQTVERYGEDEEPGVRVGWDKLVFEEDGKAEPRIVRLDDPYQHELEG